MSRPHYNINLRFVTEWGIGLAIPWFGAGLYSHVGAITDEGVGELGARIRVDKAYTGKPGVQYRPLNYANFTRSTIVKIPCTKEEHQAFWDALGEAVGKDYSALEIFGIAVGHDFKVRGRFICSALIEFGLTRADMSDYNERGRARMRTPDAVYNFTSGLRNGRNSFGFFRERFGSSRREPDTREPIPDPDLAIPARST